MSLRKSEDKKNVLIDNDKLVAHFLLELAL